jgi:UDPglucose 6-dehydrogenase
VRLTVIGTGYLGAVHAACMADIGHEVLGVDSDEERVRLLSKGQAPFFEPGLQPLLSHGIESGRLRFGISIEEAAGFGQVHFICVGTPQLGGSFAADTSGVEAVIRALGQHLRTPCLVVGKSTVPVGTAGRMAAELAAISPVGEDAELAWNPEFLREGLAVRDTLQPDRLVVGVSSMKAAEVLREVYGLLIDAGSPYITTDLATAELVKVSANAFLATKISFINGIADMCDAVGADVVKLAQALGHDSRIGRGALSAGLGFGGGCLPKDLRGLLARAQELGVGESLAFLHEVDAINIRRRERAVRAVEELIGGSLAGRDVAVLGAAFKPHTDDVRDSPSLAVAASMHLEGARVRVHDPAAIANARTVFPDLDYVTDVQDACADADVVVHLTEWPEYREIDPALLCTVVRQPRLLDARNALAHDKWEAAGWTVRGLGVRGRMSCGASVSE